MKGTVNPDISTSDIVKCFVSSEDQITTKFGTRLIYELKGVNEKYNFTRTNKQRHEYTSLLYNNFKCIIYGKD